MKSVLVVEDNADGRELLSQLLSMQTYSVTAVDNGFEALRLCLGEGRTFDAICMDLFMPGISGLGVVKQLRASGVNVPILCVSAHQAADTALGAGADAFILKPYDLDQIVAMVSRLTSRAA